MYHVFQIYSTYRTCKVHLENKQIFFNNMVCDFVQVIIHYIPLAEVAKRLMLNSKFKGHQFHGFEIQYSDRKPGARAFGHSNSTLWFETAQARADYMLHARGDAGPCRIAGLMVCSDNSYGGKHMGFHRVYCMSTSCALLVPILYFCLY